MFRFLLVLEDGEPAEPAAFVTNSANWKVGDVFEASTGQRFRIVAIDAGRSLSIFSGVMTVRPVAEKN